MILKPSIVRALLDRFGIDISRKRSHTWLSSLGIRTVIDVGANAGQFAAFARRLLPDAFIYSFEPLRGPYEALVEEFKRDARFEAFPYALGAQESVGQIHRNEFTPSSSLLPMDETHWKLFPNTAQATVVDTEIHLLDEVASRLQLDTEILVKLDVQGYEDRVIEGGRRILSRAKVLIAEVSFATLYVGQPLFPDIYKQVTALGFSYCGSLGQLLSPVDDRILQADAIFIRD